MRHLVLAVSTLAVPLLALSACGFEGTDRYADDGTAADRSANSTTQSLADSMASDDEGLGRKDPALAVPDPEQRPVMQAQVVLDRLGFGPGVIDGEAGLSTQNALRGFQEVNKLPQSGELDPATVKALARWQAIPATRLVRIPQEWGEIAFTPTPSDRARQAEMDKFEYESLTEKLAERFHTTPDVLAALNPGGRPAGVKGEGDDDRNASSGEVTFSAGQIIRVPNVGADRIAPDAVTDKGWIETLKALGVGTDQPEAVRVVVSKQAGTLRAYDESGKLVGLFTVSTGSAKDPLPLGKWQIKGIAYNPDYTYNPDLFWDAAKDEGKLRLPPGPNGPVGVVWIDLNKESYGIHGTPEPHTIGRAQSYGCVRLTNWDAARLAQMVSTDTQVEFVS